MIITGACGLDCEKMDEENDVRHPSRFNLRSEDPISLHDFRIFVVEPGGGRDVQMRSLPNIDPNAAAGVQ
jgi:hypothetical protein